MELILFRRCVLCTKKYRRIDTPYTYTIIHVRVYMYTHVFARINPYTILYPSQRYQLHMQGFEILRYTSIYNRSDLII